MRIDYKEEQANELEALQSIYPDEYEEISADPGEFTILVVPDEQDGDDTCKFLNFCRCRRTVAKAIDFSLISDPSQSIT